MGYGILFYKGQTDETAFKQYSDSNFDTGFKAANSTKKNPPVKDSAACRIRIYPMFLNITLLRLVFDLLRRLKSLTRLLLDALVCQTRALRNWFLRVSYASRFGLFARGRARALCTTVHQSFNNHDQHIVPQDILRS
jgi:hypothetical protein